MLRRSICLFAIVVALSTQSLLAQSAPKAWTADEVQKILQQRVDVDKQCVGIAVGIITAQGNQVFGYGALRKGEGSVKPDRDTVFEIGSVTKVFTTLMLADMVGRGEVALSDPASKYLPQSVTMPSRDGREITLVDLATHTSALPHMPDNHSPVDGLNPFADYTVPQMYAALSKCKLTREIGKQYQYSNLGMGLLGQILATRAGTDYETLIAERIAKPLGMNDTAIALCPSMKRRLAAGHGPSLDEVKNWDLPTLAGAGALRSTVGDMIKFVEASMGKTKSPLSAAIDLQTETRFPAGSPKLSIALAWHKLAIKGGDIVWHNGQTGGYHSFIGFDKKRRVGVVVLANTAADIDDIGLHLLDRQIPLRVLEPKKVRTAIKLDPKSLDGYVGDYELSPTFVIAITKQNDRLMMQPTAQPKGELFAESEKDFFLKAIDVQITFVNDDAGKVTELILHQGGAHQRAKKRPC